MADGGYPAGVTQAIHDATFCVYDENDRMRAAEELAEQDWDAFVRGEDPHGTIADFVGEHLCDCAADIMRGGSYYEQAVQRIRRDAIGYAAYMMDEDRVEAAL